MKFSYEQPEALRYYTVKSGVSIFHLGLGRYRVVTDGQNHCT